MNNKKTVLHIIQSLDSGGCENMLLRTLPLLDDFEHTLITLNKEGELAEKFKEKGFRLITIGQKNLLNPLPYFRLIMTVKKIRPAIIITYLFHADMIGRLFLQPLISCHSRADGNPVHIIPFLRTTYNHPRYRIARLTERLTKYFVKQYLANSESVKNFYVESIGVKKEKITVIPNGIDTNFYANIPRDENLRESFGIKKEDIAIICVANLHINKGHKYLLEAFEKVFCHSRESGNPVPYLLLVGDGNEKGNLLKQIANYQSKNNVLFLGKRNDVPRLLKISDIFVLPTLFEGMSNAIMEAMACGLAVITTNISENKELIENEIDGILVAASDSNIITKKLLDILININKKEQLGFMAKKLIKSNYEINSIISKWNNQLCK